MSYLTNPYMVTASGGTYTSTADTDCILCNGGATYPPSTLAEKYVGVSGSTGSWSSLSSSPTTNTKGSGGGGNSTGAIMIAGATLSGDVYATDTVNFWDGSTWSTSVGTNISTATWMTMGGGSNDSAFWCGGLYTYTSNSQTWDGSAWSGNNALSHGTRGACANGFADSARCVGGYTTGTYNQRWNQGWDGNSWTDQTDFPLTDSSGSGGSPTSPDSYSAYGSNAGAGTADSFLVNQRDINATGLYSWNGSAWSQGNATNYMHVFCMLGGDPDVAMKAGGEDTSTGLGTTTCEVLQSGVWNTTGALTCGANANCSFDGTMGGNTVS